MKKYRVYVDFDMTAPDADVEAMTVKVTGPDPFKAAETALQRVAVLVPSLKVKNFQIFES